MVRLFFAPKRWVKANLFQGNVRGYFQCKKCKISKYPETRKNLFNISLKKLYLTFFDKNL